MGQTLAWTKRQDRFCDMGIGVSRMVSAAILMATFGQVRGWVGEGFRWRGIFFAPDGDLIGKIHLPEVLLQTFCFGGVKRKSPVS